MTGTITWIKLFKLYFLYSYNHFRFGYWFFFAEEEMRVYKDKK